MDSPKSWRVAATGRWVSREAVGAGGHGAGEAGGGGEPRRARPRAPPAGQDEGDREVGGRRRGRVTAREREAVGEGDGRDGGPRAVDQEFQQLAGEERAEGRRDQQ